MADEERLVTVEAWVLEELVELVEAEYATSHTYNVAGGAVDVARAALAAGTESERAAGTAHLIEEQLPNFNGHANLYRLDPPMEYEDKTIEYVVVSATNVVFSGPETYIFAADSDGEVEDWEELPGSFQGGLDHAAALAGAGYAVEANR